MKKVALLLFASVLAVAMVLPACQAAPPEVTDWQMLHINNITDPPHPEVVAVNEFIDMVWEDSNQTLRISARGKGEAGYKGPEIAGMVKDNSLQIATTTGGYYSGEEPLLGITELMLMYTADDIPTALDAGKPYFQEVWDRSNALLLGNGCFPNGLWSDELILKLEDFSGKKFRATGATVRLGWESVGGASVVMPSSDIYMALQTGIIDCSVHGIISGIAGHYYEVVKYAIVDPIMNAASIHLICSKDAFNALPKKTQDMLIESGKKFQRRLIEVYVPSQDNVTFLQGEGVTCNVFSPAELARMQEQMARPAWYQWADEKGVREGVDAVAKALGL
jgi:TRAP-type C4-dicarboxylate transport system substrate-binding protein